MEKLITYAVTAQALKTLMRSAEFPSVIPEGWFNWTQGDISRLTICSIANNGQEIVTWSNTALAAGYGCFLITSTEEPLCITDLEGLSNDVIPYIIDRLPMPGDPNEHNRLQTILQRPENLVVSEWMALLMGGGAPFECEGTSPAQWWEYARGLKTWAFGPTSSLDLNSWRDVPGVDPVFLSTEHFDFNAPWTTNEIPQLEQDGIVQFYPTWEMPCCGIAIDTKGKLHTIGALPTEPDGTWAFDDGSIRQAFEQKAKEVFASV